MAERPIDHSTGDRPLRGDAPRQSSWAMGLVAILGVLLLVGIIWAVAVNDDEKREPTARVESQRTTVDIDSERNQDLDVRSERSQGYEVFIRETQGTLDRLELQQQNAEQQARIQELRSRVGELESADAQQAARIRSEIEASVMEMEREVEARESADTANVVTTAPPAATDDSAEAEAAMQQARERLSALDRQLGQVRQQAGDDFSTELRTMETRIDDLDKQLDDVAGGPERQQLEADLAKLEADLRQLADRVADVAGR
ncbi:MAG: hypothetical protein HY319_30425 [Armatimonadetes bacterium]|nr:hypothetical protein [Armatimonadota bacterium]